MRNVIQWLMMSTLKLILWFRYRIKVEGAEKLNKATLNKPGGVLFLPNHPSYFIDPSLVPSIVYRKYPIRPMIVEYMYYLPGVNLIMRFLKALPIPNFHSSSNSLKKKRTDQVFDAVLNGLRNGDNFLIYPAGKVKYTAKESVGGASGVQRILQESPETNIVLVRIKGLWGSSFSRAIVTCAPSLPATLLWALKTIFKNLIFFTPRRTITVCFEPAPADFPRSGSRLEINRYLENWYNLPDGLSQPRESSPGDTLVLVSYSMWGEQYFPLHAQTQDESVLDIQQIPDDVKQKVYKKLAQVAEIDPQSIQPEMALDADLGLDSIDLAEIAAYLQDDFDVEPVSLDRLKTVKTLLAIAAGKSVLKNEASEYEQTIGRWKVPFQHVPAVMPLGETIHEVFLRICDKMGKMPACADEMSGVLTFSQMKLRVLLIAEYLRKLPGKNIGILLPASIGANILILGALLAGKVPIMINWTIGPRHLEAVIKLSGVSKVLTSWSFLDRLDNVNLEGVEDLLVMMEEARREISMKDKLKAKLRSKYSVESILKAFNAPCDGLEQAVILFTSGTESLPKGVPLTHHNILSNQRASQDIVGVFKDDVLFAILPPFHAFGFTISSLMALLLGVRTAFSPNPTDGKRLARGIQKWGATLLCGAPTFLKAIARAANKGDLATLRLCVTGAEKAPPELFELFAQHGKRDALIEGYGITECSPVLTFTRPGKPLIGVGHALPNVDICIVHPETYEKMPHGEQGLIIARGPSVFSGYLNPGLSSPFISVDGMQWYKTGDLGYFDDDQNLIIAGRQKRFVKVGGEMVSLSAIEEAVLHSILKTRSVTPEEGPLVAVCAREVPGEKPKVVLCSRVNLTVEEVNQILRESGFSNLVKVSQVVYLIEIPIMGSGKVNYRFLEGEYLVKKETEAKV